HVLLRFNAQFLPEDTLMVQGAGFFCEILAEPQGGLYLGGSCGGTMVFPDTTIFAPSIYLQHLISLDADHKLRWVRFFPDFTCSAPSLAPAPQHGIYYANFLNDTMTLDGIFLQGTNWGHDFMLLRIDSLGSVQWAREMPTGGFSDATLSRTGALASDALGNTYLTGQTRGNIQWSSTVVTTSAVSDYNVWLMSYDVLGTPRWALAGGGAGYDLSHGVAAAGVDLLANSGLLAAGGSLGSQSISCQGFTNPYRALVSPLTSRGVADPDASRALVFPNPTDGDAWIRTASTAQQVFLHALDGRLLFHTEPMPSGITALPAAILEPGIYLVSIIDQDGSRATVRLIRAH
ncbi:MAG TPA: T9SS type A sorting domain-containing protein, partial [Bacteroidales bacterium]|nr:T9SS type A sorting domain-containing protein [Bacteroidales bacterium]